MYFGIDILHDHMSYTEIFQFHASIGRIGHQIGGISSLPDMVAYYEHLSYISFLKTVLFINYWMIVGREK